VKLKDMASFFRFSCESPVRSLPRMDIVSVIVFNAIFNNMAVNCIDRGNCSTRR